MTYLGYRAHHHHDVSVVPTELRAGELHREGQLGVVDGELRLECDLVLLVRGVLHPDIGRGEGNHLPEEVRDDTKISKRLQLWLPNNYEIKHSEGKGMALVEGFDFGD